MTDLFSRPGMMSRLVRTVVARALLVGLIGLSATACSRHRGAENNMAGAPEAGPEPSPPATPISNLLADEAAATGQIAIASAPAGTPTRLDLMILTARGVNAGTVFSGGLRAIRPFSCVRVDHKIACRAAFAATDGADDVGSVSILLFDHDVAAADGETDLAGIAVPSEDQSTTAFDPGLQRTESDGTVTHFTSHCRQMISTTKVGAIACYTLLDARTEVLISVDPLRPDGADPFDGSTRGDTARAEALLRGGANLVLHLRAVTTQADGGFKASDLGDSAYDVHYSDAGWYVLPDATTTELLAGPLSDEGSCTAALANVAASAIVLGMGTNNQVECKQLDSAP